MSRLALEIRLSEQLLSAELKNCQGSTDEGLLVVLLLDPVGRAPAIAGQGRGRRWRTSGSWWGGAAARAGAGACGCCWGAAASGFVPAGTPGGSGGSHSRALRNFDVGHTRYGVGAGGNKKTSCRRPQALVVQALAASQAARSAGPWKSSRATPAEAAANASSTCHPEGKGDEVELFIAWGGLEACQAAFSVISGTQSFSMLEASRWVVIRLVP